MDLSSFSVEALTRRRPINKTEVSLDGLHTANEGSSNSLKRRLNALDLIFYGVGCSVGAGIYSLVGIGAKVSGPSIALSFAVAGIACCFTSLSYSEFAALLKTAGSAYSFAYVTFGELTGWLVGWNLTLGYAVSAAVVARSWAEYSVDFLQSYFLNAHGNEEDGDNSHFQIQWLTKLPLPGIGGDGYTCCPLSILIIGICTLVLVTGVKESAKFNLVMTLLNLSVLALVVFLGTPVVDTDNWFPIFPHGIPGMARGAGLIFFAYLGFDMVSCLSEETINPEVNMPIGIIGSLFVSMSIYVTVAAVVVGMAPVSLLGEDVPIVNALLINACCNHDSQLGEDATKTCLSYACDPVIHPILKVGSHIVSAGSIAGLTTACFTCLMGQPRIFYSIAQDGLFFQIYSKVNPKTGVPTMGTVITGFLTALIACFFDLEVLANGISLGTLQVFTFVNAGVILLRMRPPASEVFEEEMSPFRPRSPFSEDPGANETALSLGLRKETSVEIRNSLSGSSRRLVTSKFNDTKPIWFVLGFTLSALLLSVAIAQDWALLITAASVVGLGVFSVLLYRLPQTPPPETFACPMVPAIPLLGVASNCYLMGSMQANTWFLIAGWLSIGLLFYFSYGIHHSKLRVKEELNKSEPKLPKFGSPATETQDLLPPGRLHSSNNGVQTYDSTRY